MAYIVHGITERGQPLERTLTAYAQLAYGPTDPISPGHVRDLTGGERAVLAAGHYHVYARVLVENGAGVLVNYGDFGPEGRQWFSRARWSEGIDNPVVSGECELWLEQDGLSLAPLVRASALNRGAGGDYAPALDAGRRIEIHTATVAPGTVPDDDSFRVALIGKVDAVDWTAREGRLSIAFRDLGAWLVDTHIRTERTYEDEEGIPLGELIQRILDDNPHRPGVAGPVLHVMGDPDWYVRRHMQPKHTSVFEAIRALAQQIGWDLRYRWTDAGYQLTLYLPGRERVTADLVLGPDEYLEVGEAKLGDANVRNDFELTYRAADGEIYTVAHGNPVSQVRYGYRYMFIGEASTSTIDTDAEAVRMVTAIASDLDTPEFTHAAKLRYWWAVQLGDIVDFHANDVHYDDPQRLAVQAVEHVLENGGGYTTVACSGRPRGAYQGWLGKGSGTRGEGFEATLTPVIDVRLTHSSPTQLVYEITGSTAGGEEVWLYLGEGADPRPATPIPNPHVLAVPRATVDRQHQFHRVLARSGSGREATALLGSDYDYVPGILFTPRAEPLFAAGEQIGWRQELYVDDDARGLRVRVAAGAAVFHSSTPPAQVVGGTDYWLDVGTAKSVTLNWEQEPGRDAQVEVTPFEYHGPSRLPAGGTAADVEASAGARGVPLEVRLARAPVTSLTVTEQGPGLRRLVFTMSPPDGTLHFQIGNATARQVRQPVYQVDGVEVSSDVLVRWYGVSDAGVPEPTQTRLLDQDDVLRPPVVNVHESPANTLTVSLGIDEEALVWRVWARRGAWPVDTAGTPLPQYLVADGNPTDTDFSFYAAGSGDPGSRWYVVARVFDNRGTFEETRVEKLVHGSTTEAGFVSGVRARLTDHGGGTWFNEVTWDFNDVIESAGASAYRIDLYQNGVRVAEDLDPRIDPDGTPGQAGRGGYRIRVVGATPGTPESTVRTFVYDVGLWRLEGGSWVPDGTNRVSFSALYRGDGEYQPIPTTSPVPVALVYESWSDRLAAAWSNVSPGYAVDIEYQAIRSFSLDPYAPLYQLEWEEEELIQPVEVFRLEKDVTAHWLSAPWDRWLYRFRVRHVANTGSGPWSGWSHQRLVLRPSGSTGGSGSGGLPPTQLVYIV